MFDWDSLVVHLRSSPAQYHRLLPPCPRDKVDVVCRELGGMPAVLVDMFAHFNGAELFIFGTPLLSLFRVSDIPPLSKFEWNPEWCIDTYVRRWRNAMPDREPDWPFAMTNYGGLMLAGNDCNVNEWDTIESRWLTEGLPFKNWMDKMLATGESMMAELS